MKKKPKRSKLPAVLKKGIQALSGCDVSNVKVHYNSAKPAQVQAQGPDIHVSRVQEKHLPHEAWHVVQQKRGRVQPTVQMAPGVPINDDNALEQAAEGMGVEALKQVVDREK